MKNYKLIISYDGTNFHGFQIQKDKTTVQGEFQKALEIFTKKYELNYSGRTDAGVHAKAQVINIKTELDKLKIIANELELDLVEVSPESKPPVARLMDYGKYKYELAQKAKESRKNQVKISVKEIQLKPKIDTNDFKIKLQKSRKFLETGDKVKFTMRFRGREAEHPEFGQKVLDNYKEELSDIAELESTSNPDGRSITMVLAPIGGKK